MFWCHIFYAFFFIASANSDYAKPTRFKCWGYEPDCDQQESYSNHYLKCSNLEDRQTFYKEADFGYVEKRLKTLKPLCQGKSHRQGNLKCSDQLQFCQGENIWIDFRDLADRHNEILRYSKDVLKHGQVRAKCDFDSKALQDEIIHTGPLQSWAAELENFAPFASNEVIPCDVRIERPTIIMKLDATVNMYHHFCDFFNLFASLHINGSLENRNVNILVWENLSYKSSFAPAFDAFTQHPILDLNTYAGKRVCFKHVMLPLLPRMLYGLFYNTPLTPNDCENSGLFKAFSDFMTSRLAIQTPKITNCQKINVTILARRTAYRRILNLGTLEKALLDTDKYHVKIAPFTHNFPFREQMEIIANTDILVGIHGAGLTHMLFLPEWAAVFELYDCQDPSCYKDLAKLCGLKHLSWSNMDKIIPEKTERIDNPEISAKFANYAFDPDEFLLKIEQAAQHVKNHPTFQNLDISNQPNELHDEL